MTRKQALKLKIDDIVTMKGVLDYGIVKEISDSGFFVKWGDGNDGWVSFDGAKDFKLKSNRGLKLPYMYHVHTDSCYSPIPETEGIGEYLSCSLMAGNDRCQHEFQRLNDGFICLKCKTFV